MALAWEQVEPYYGAAPKEDEDLPLVSAGKLPAPGESLPPAMRGRIESFLAGLGDAFELVDKGNAVGACVYDVKITDGFACPLPHLAKTRNLARCLALRAAIEADSGDVDACARTVRAQLALAGSLRREPMLISQLVRLAIDAIAADSLERTLARGPLAEGESLGLEAALLDEARSSWAFLPTVFVYERAFGLDVFERMLDGRLDIRSIEGLGSEQQPSEFGRLLLASLGGPLKENAAFHLTVMNRMIDAAKLPPAESVVAVEELDRELTREMQGGSLRNLDKRIAAMTLPALSHAYANAARSSAALDLARAALAVERFRAAEGRMPGTLGELVPKYMAEVPGDPFSKGAVMLKPLDGGGFTVYSVGEDRTDNGGTVNPKYPADRGKGYDVVFRVARRR
jgi:hypothetical protein